MLGLGLMAKIYGLAYKQEAEAEALQPKAMVLS